MTNRWWICWYLSDFLIDLQIAKLESTKTPIFGLSKSEKSNNWHPCTHRAFLRITKRKSLHGSFPQKTHYSKFNFHSKIDGDLSKRFYIYSIVPHFFWRNTVDGRNPAPEGVVHLRSCRISSINCIIKNLVSPENLAKTASAELFKDPKKAHNPKPYLGLSSYEQWTPTNINRVVTPMSRVLTPFTRPCIYGL